MGEMEKGKKRLFTLIWGETILWARLESPKAHRPPFSVQPNRGWEFFHPCFHSKQTYPEAL